jgi:hypothetical protein
MESILVDLFPEEHLGVLVSLFDKTELHCRMRALAASNAALNFGLSIRPLQLSSRVLYWRTFYPSFRAPALAYRKRQNADGANATWNGVALSAVNNGARVLYNHLSSGDLTLLMIDMDQMF